MQLNSGLWSNLLKKAAIGTTFYFAVQEKSVLEGKNR